MSVRKLLPVLVLACKLLSGQSAPPEPILKSAGQLRYPALARAARIEGQVRLEFVLNQNGDPSSVVVVSGHPMLASPAAETVKTWKFEFPENAFQEGRKYETTFHYKLSKEEFEQLFLPILDGASIQDDDDLHTRWAALLANAATSPTLVHPSYIELLKQLTPEDAQLLDRLYDSCKAKRHRSVTPWVNTISYAERERRVAAGEKPEIPFQNLVRFGLIETVYTIDSSKVKVRFTQGRSSKFEGKLDDHYELTESADPFVQACRAPKTIDAT
jgi:TonB family protein